MNNLLQFTIKLNDQISAALRKVAGSGKGAQDSLDKIAASQNKLNQLMQAGGNSIDTLGKKIEALRARRNLLPEGAETQIRAINSEINQLTRQMTRLETMNGSKLKVWAKDAFNQLPGAGLITNPLVMAGAAATYGLKQAMDVQASKVKFQTLMGGEKKGNAMYGQLKGYADVTPYSKDDLLKGGETLLNYGVKSEKIMPIIKMMGDISGGSADRLNSLSLAFGQVYAKGHLAGQEVLQMVNAGFNPLQAISEKTGKSMNELDTMMRDGAITVGMVEQAMQSVTGPGGRFNGMMEKLSGTLQGQLSTFMDKFNDVMAKLGEAILPIANAALGLLSAALTKVVGLFSSVVGWVNENKRGLLTLVGAVTAAYLAYKAYNAYQWVTYLWMMRTSVAEALAVTAKGIDLAMTEALTVATEALSIAFLSTPLGWLMLGFGALAGALLYNSGLMDKMADSTDGASQAYKELYDKTTLAANIHKKATEGTSEYILKATMLLDRVKAVSVQESERKKALSELVAMDKDAFGGLTSLAIAYDKGGSALEKYTAKMFEHAEAMAAVETYKKVFADNIEAQWQNHEKFKEKQYYYGVKQYNAMGVYTGEGKEYVTNEADLKRYRERDEKIANATQRNKAQETLNWLKGNFIKKDDGANKSLVGINDPIKANNAAGGGDNEDKTAKGVVSGGARVINIYISKMIEKVELHATTVREGMDRVADDLKEPLLRVLNSGAKMQS